MASGLGLLEMLRDRLSKHGLYDTPAYWDKKAVAYEGLARSIWPSNVYNRHWDQRQMGLIDRTLGDVTGLAIADVACGTGRASRHLARRGAKVTGLDFAPKTLEAARSETASEGLAVDYRIFDALAPAPADLVGKFDAVMSISCLSVACSSLAELDRAVSCMTAMAKPGGRVLLLEPLHASRLVRRILELDVNRFVERAAGAGLRLLSHDGMGFIPVRLAMAFRDLPDAIVRPAFALGERWLDGAPWLMPLADYHCLLFRRATAPEASR